LLETASGVFVGVATSSGNCGYGTIFRYSLAGDTVTGNTRCGQKKNDSGGGSAGFAVILLFAGLGLLRRRAV
jgi:MYXO-CTERM domain-containing protein